jgi:hypothetical protein
MKTNFKFLFLIIITSLIACDDKIQSLEDLNKAPNVEYYTLFNGIWKLSSDNETINETVKYYNEANQLPYSISLKFKDVNKNFGFVSLNSSQFDNQFFVNDKPFRQNFKVELDSFSLSFKNEFDLNKKFSMIIEDTWGKRHKLNFNLDYIENIPPTADLRMNVINNNEYEIDASNSNDGDKQYGGFIRQYEYVINNNFLVQTSNNKIRHVFAAGTHNIKLRVKDNDNIWSNYVERNITIN